MRQTPTFTLEAWTDEGEVHFSAHGLREQLWLYEDEAYVDGWEKTKMKKKRSAMKPDVSPNLGSAKPMDGYREPKQGMQQRPVIDARTRLNSDSHGFRYTIITSSNCLLDVILYALLFH